MFIVVYYYFLFCTALLSYQGGFGVAGEILSSIGTVDSNFYKKDIH